MKYILGWIDNFNGVLLAIVLDVLQVSFSSCIHLMGLHCTRFCLMEGKSVSLRGLFDFFTSSSVCWPPTSRIKFSIPSCAGLNRKG